MFSGGREWVHWERMGQTSFEDTGEIPEVHLGVSITHIRWRFFAKPVNNF